MHADVSYLDESLPTEVCIFIFGDVLVNSDDVIEIRRKRVLKGQYFFRDKMPCEMQLDTPYHKLLESYH